MRISLQTGDLASVGGYAGVKIGFVRVQAAVMGRFR